MQRWGAGNSSILAVGDSRLAAWLPDGAAGGCRDGAATAGPRRARPASRGGRGDDCAPRQWPGAVSSCAARRCSPTALLECAGKLPAPSCTALHPQTGQPTSPTSLLAEEVRGAGRWPSSRGAPPAAGARLETLAAAEPGSPLLLLILHYLMPHPRCSVTMASSRCSSSRCSRTRWRRRWATCRRSAAAPSWRAGPGCRGRCSRCHWMHHAWKRHAMHACRDRAPVLPPMPGARRPPAPPCRPATTLHAALRPRIEEIDAADSDTSR